MTKNTRLSTPAQLQFRVPERGSLGTRLPARCYGQFVTHSQAGHSYIFQFALVVIQTSRETVKNKEGLSVVNDVWILRPESEADEL